MSRSKQRDRQIKEKHKVSTFDHLSSLGFFALNAFPPSPACYATGVSESEPKLGSSVHLVRTAPVSFVDMGGGLVTFLL